MRLCKQFVGRQKIAYYIAMSNAKIVITDDEKIVTSAFKTLLRVEGYNDVNCFNNPLDAVEFLKNNQPDIIISDFLG